MTVTIHRSDGAHPPGRPTPNESSGAEGSEARVTVTDAGTASATRAEIELRLAKAHKPETVKHGLVIAGILSWAAFAAATIALPDRTDVVVEATALTGTIGGVVALARAVAYGVSFTTSSAASRLRQRLSTGVPWLLATGLWFLIWELTTAKSTALPRPYFTPPQQVLGILIEDRVILAESVGNSLLLLTIGLAIGLLAGLVTGVTSGWSRTFNYWQNPFLQIFGPLPSVAAAALIVVSLSQLLVQFAWIRSALDGVPPPEPADVFVFLGGTYAFAIWLRLIVLAALWLLLSSASRAARAVAVHRDARLTWGGILLSGVVAAASTAMTGHGGVDLLRLVPATVHGFAAIFWLGGLAVLVFAVATRRLEESTVSALGRWSLLAGISVAVLVLTGIVQSVWQVGYLGATWSTPYGRVLLFKLALVVVALLAALAAWLWTRRRAAQDSGRPPPGQTRRFRRRVSLEATAGLAILVVSGLLSHMTPAASDYRPVVQGTSDLGAYDVDVAIENSRVGSQTVRLLVEGTSSEVPLPESVTARLSSAEAGVASIEVEFPFRSTLPVGPDVAIPVQYQSLPVNVPLDGTWELEIQVVESERREHVARVAYEVVP